MIWTLNTTKTFHLYTIWVLYHCTTRWRTFYFIGKLSFFFYLAKAQFSSSIHFHWHQSFTKFPNQLPKWKNIIIIGRDEIFAFYMKDSNIFFFFSDGSWKWTDSERLSEITFKPRSMITKYKNHNVGNKSCSTHFRS